MSMVFDSRPDMRYQRETCAPRRAQVPIVDFRGNGWRPSVANLIDNIACYTLRARDIMDFGLNFSEWLEVNGGSVLTSAAWAAAVDSPMAPTIGTSQMFPAGETFCMIGPGVAGDVYWLDCTAVVAIAQQRDGQAIPTASRTLVRRILINVMAG